MLSSITNAKLVQRAWIHLDPLTSTDLDRELIVRLEATLSHDAAIGMLANHGVETDDIDSMKWADEALTFAETRDECGGVAAAEKLLAVLTEFDIDEPDTLRAQLERIKKFDQVMEDLKTPLASLQQLATTE